MAIHKAVSERQNVYVPIEILTDPNLNLEERGFMAVLYSLPEDTQFSLEMMSELTGDRIGILRRVFRKLIAKGYIVPREPGTRKKL